VAGTSTRRWKYFGWEIDICRRSDFDCRTEARYQQWINPEIIPIIDDHLDPTLLTVIVLTIIGLPVLICLLWGINRKRTRPFATLIQLTALTFGVLICFKEGRSDYTKSAIIAFVAGVLLTGLAMFQIQRMRKAKALLNSQQSATGQRRSVTHAS
jgi:hypothetical protein